MQPPQEEAEEEEEEESQATCPCFDMEQVYKFETRLKKEKYDQKFVLDLYKSCKDPETNNGLPFGLYTKPSRRNSITHPGLWRQFKEGYSSMNPVKFGIDIGQSGDGSEDNMNKCYHGSTSLTISTAEQVGCTTMINRICSKIQTLDKNPSCQDDTIFRLKSMSWASCDRIVGNQFGKKSIKKNCNKYDEATDKFVFQHCRKSCQSCTCTSRDDSNYTYNGQSNFTCEWISSLPKDEQKSYCKDDDVSKYCSSTCNTKCCQNKSKFRFNLNNKNENGMNPKNDDGTREGRRRKRHSCNDIGNANWEDVCKSKKISRRCPMTCRRCAIQPK